MAPNVFGTAHGTLRSDPQLYLHRAMEIHLAGDLWILRILFGDDLPAFVVLGSSARQRQDANKCDGSDISHWLTSKHKAQHTLYESRIARSIDVPKGAGVGDVSVRVEELGVIKEIERFSTQFHLQRFLNGKCAM